jgi:hypothetical protein
MDSPASNFHLPISIEASLELDSLNQVVEILERLPDPLDTIEFSHDVVVMVHLERFNL